MAKYVISLVIVFGFVLHVHGYSLYDVYMKDGIINPSGPAIQSNNTQLFILNGKPIRLFSGSFHYFRSVPEYWRNILRKMKAAGLNTVQTYVAWNLHSSKLLLNGTQAFNFEGYWNLRQFLKMCQEEDLFVVFRPGPYICAEWEFGGLPGWLFQVNNSMKIRSGDSGFMRYAQEYLVALFKLTDDLQFTKGGPIIAYQIENEYAWFKNDADYKYMQQLKQIYLDNGVIEMLFTCDNYYAPSGPTGSIEGVLMTANLNSNANEFLTHFMKFQQNRPIFVTEFWPGWFDFWGKQHQTQPTQKMADVLKEILDFNGNTTSVNFYMFYGGTNFGFWNGANGGNEFEGLSPVTTSYDYDAPLKEDGDYTSKYTAFKHLIRNHTIGQIWDVTLPDPPQINLKQKYGTVSVSFEADIFSVMTAGKKHRGLQNITLPMEFYNASYGFIMYETLNVSSQSALFFKGRVRDRAIIWFGEHMVTVISSDMVNATVPLSNDTNSVTENLGTLRIIVENQGRSNTFSNSNRTTLTNYGKGLVENVAIGSPSVNVKWQVYTQELYRGSLEKLITSTNAVKSDTHRMHFDTACTNERCPGIYTAIFDIEGEPNDTFLNMGEWTHGVVFVNWFNLGRYWNIGPAVTLYVPAPLLRRGRNEITIVETDKENPNKTIHFKDKHIFRLIPKGGEPHPRSEFPGTETRIRADGFTWSGVSIEQIVDG